MSILCKLNFHSWDGCECNKCGTKRNGGHYFGFKGCEHSKCSKCGKDNKNNHNWHYCKCINCGKYIDDNHNWKGCRCNVCGKVDNDKHEWSKENCEKCIHCKNIFEGNHNWDGCKCTNCGTVRNENHSWDGCKCSKCNKWRDEYHTWNGCKCTKCNIYGNGNHTWSKENCNYCTICKKEFEGNHVWDDCICSKCGLIKSFKESGHLWEDCVCTKCGTIGDLGHIWNNCTCTKCGSINENHVYDNDKKECSICQTKIFGNSIQKYIQISSTDTFDYEYTERFLVNLFQDYETSFRYENKYAQLNYQNVFKNYWKIIKAFSIMDAPASYYSNSSFLSRYNQAVNILISLNTKMTSNLLHFIIRYRTNFEICTLSVDGYAQNTPTINFSPIKKNIIRELHKRGNPLYEPEIFNDSESWIAYDN